MIIYLTHPEHGRHIAYTETEAITCETQGWTREVPAAAVAPGGGAPLENSGDVQPAREQQEVKAQAPEQQSASVPQQFKMTPLANWREKYRQQKRRT